MGQKLGYIFGEALTTSKKRYRQKKEVSAYNYKRSLFIFPLVFILAFCLLFFRLFKLTVFQGGYYKELADNNRLRENIFPAPRGIILDRKGEIIVQNKPGFIAQVECGRQLCFKKITHEEALKLEAKNQIHAFTLGVSREYKDPFAFSHIIGTTGNVNEDELDKEHCGKKLTYQDELGRSGVEAAFDCLLEGKPGKELYETNALGEKIKVLSRIEPQTGQNLVLSIDNNLQLKAMELMQGKTGAVIVQIPQTGEILVLYSSPSYNLDKFVEGLSEEEYQKLLQDKNQPLLNRAIGAVYPPGSTFKTVIAAGALEEKVINKDTQIEDTGVITIGAFSFANWYFTQYGKKEGLITITGAIKRSNDVFFYKVGEMLGVDKISAWANKFKLGQKLGIEISGEAAGFIPDINWKEKVKGEQWFLGDTYHLAIGQGSLVATPLQIAFVNGVFGNNGVMCRPTLLKTDNCDKITGKLVSAQNLQIIKEGMVEVCQTGGTAYPFFDYKMGGREIKIACKTGTAEYGPQASGKNQTHAWFTAFAPVDNPQISVTVLVEGGGEGSTVAAPIAKALMDEWFNR